MTARHVMILASAGSGKTYALTNRFVGLLAEGAPPERIVALTFTRKAAGEFFDEILNKLGRAARDEVFAARLAQDLGRPGLGPAVFLRLLREVIDAMHRLRLGTLDSFFARITRAFPFELGLAGEFEVLQEHAAAVERRRVLRRIFARSSGGLDEAQREFVEAFKRATFGTEEKRLAARLDAFIDEHQEAFLSAPMSALWGDLERIWPEGCPWTNATPPLNDAVAALRALLARRGLPDKQLARWDAFFAALPEWAAGAPLPAPVEYVVKNTFAAWDAVQRGAAEIVIERRKLALGPDECVALAAIVKHIVCAELTRRLEATRGIHAVLRGYEAVYDETVRRSGKLTFADVLRLLVPDTSGLVLSRAVDADGTRAENRLLIDFRLDAQFDHWLLDEFQDTSFGQWSVLRNLIDEVVQDPTGARSFFCVGDVKQAIYAWRDGDPRLLREIFEHYNRAAPGAIAEEHLVASYRSGPDVIAMVNAVFGASAAIAHLFPGGASATWNREWRTHSTARPKLGGHATWLHGIDEEERFALTVRILQEIAPVERGLTCAVLTQTNATATALADYLRREGGLPAMADSDLHVCTDNPLGSALLAVVKAAAHPGDTLAWEHAIMTPLRVVLAAEGIHAPEQLTLRLLGQIHADGFERTLEFWVRAAERVLAPHDEFTRERGQQLVAAGAQFDATGSRDVAEFVAFMERHTLRDADSAGVVRVMTIHKSKGLGFDVVLLPDLEGQRLDQRRGGLAVQRSAERVVEWVVELPPKLFYAQDERLSAHVHAAEAESAYEALSLLYVAMTRAKRAMYLITKPVGTSESRNYPKLLTTALGGEVGTVTIGRLSCPGTWASGDPAWFEPIVATEELRSEHAAILTHAELAHAGWPRVPRRTSRRPSAQKVGIVLGAQLFSLEGSAGLDFGTDVHELLKEVEWASAELVAAHATAWPKRGLDRVATHQAIVCLEAPALAHVWRRPPAGEVWRERPFEIVLGDAWVTGVFDRVIVECDANDGSRPAAARVFDFKSDAVESEADIQEALARHRSQLNLYREVAAVLTGLPLGQVTCELVFTRLARSVVVPPV
jgi:ATP-dependent exoDNAse (exonuclease V) beta subunit